MTCYPSTTTPAQSICGLPIGLDWLEVSTVTDQRRIACLTCRAGYLTDHPGTTIPIRTQAYAACYTVTTDHNDTRGLSWEDALYLYRRELELQEADYDARITEVVSVFLTEGTRVIAGVCRTLEFGLAVDTRLPESERYPYLAAGYGA